MHRKHKIIIAGGLAGVVLGVLIGLLLAKRAAEDGEPVVPPDGKKLLKVGMSLVALVRLIQEL
jgi:hypothetical protein